jgi:hypothetical protein
MHFALISHDKHWFGEKHPRYADKGYHHKQPLERFLETELQCPVSNQELKTKDWICRMTQQSKSCHMVHTYEAHHTTKLCAGIINRIK